MMKLRHICSLQVPVSEPLTPDPAFPLFSVPSKRNVKPAFCLHRRMVIVLPKGCPRGAHQPKTLKHFLILPSGCQNSFHGRCVSFTFCLCCGLVGTLPSPTQCPLSPCLGASSVAQENGTLAGALFLGKAVLPRRPVYWAPHPRSARENFAELTSKSPAFCIRL